MGDANWRRLGNVFGLTQFGINLETYQPGAQSALRHWHTLTDEFVYVLEGELVLRTDVGETLMCPGMCAGSRPARATPISSSTARTSRRGSW